MELSMTDTMDFKQFTANTACFNDWYQPYQQLAYINYPIYACWHQPSKIEQAFKVVQKLLAKDLIKLNTVKSFIEAVGEIAECL